MLETFEMNVSREAVVEAIQKIVPGWPGDISEKRFHARDGYAKTLKQQTPRR